MTRWWMPAGTAFAFLFGSALVTLILLLLDGHGKEHYVLRTLYRLNDAAVRESLEMKVSVTMTFVALIACLIALGIRTRAIQKVCVDTMTQPLKLKVLWIQWSRDNRIISPAGVLTFIFLLDLFCAKVGATITSTIVGVCFYLLLKGQPVYMTLLGSLAMMWAICVFPAFIRSIFELSLQKGYDTRLRRARRLLFRDLRARWAQAVQ